MCKSILKGQNVPGTDGTYHGTDGTCPRDRRDAHQEILYVYWFFSFPTKLASAGGQFAVTAGVCSKSEDEKECFVGLAHEDSGWPQDGCLDGRHSASDCHAALSRMQARWGPKLRAGLALCSRVCSLALSDK